MAQAIDITPDKNLIDELAAAFDLRESNKEALTALVGKLWNYDPDVEYVMHMATGAGKTYLMAAFIEYLRRSGYYNVAIITPGLVIQDKTVANFEPGSRKYIAGIPPAQAPRVFRPGALEGWAQASTGTGGVGRTNLFIFNIHQVTAPSTMEGQTKAGDDSVQRGLRKDSEVWGNVHRDLKKMDDLVVLLDESHLYSESAESFHAAIRELDPALIIGLTATLSDEMSDKTEIIHTYPLYKAIADRNVLAPTLAMRKNGYDNNETLQLKDARALLNRKRKAYAEFATTAGVEYVKPIMFVVCESKTHATEVAGILASPSFFGSTDAVLQIDSTTMKTDSVREALANVDLVDSPVEVVVSVSMLKEGWDVKNVAVVCSLRLSASKVLTHQTMGRGLRLPFGKYTGVSEIDQLDILSHESFKKAMTDEGILNSFYVNDLVKPGTKPTELPATRHNASGTPSTDIGGEEFTDTGSNNASASDLTGGLFRTDNAESSAEENTAVTNAENEQSSSDSAQPTSPSAGLGIADVTDEERAEELYKPEPRDFELRGNFFWFPASRTTAILPGPFNLGDILPKTLQNEAAKVTASGELISREEISPSPRMRKLNLQLVESAEGETIALDEDLVIQSLTDMLLKDQVLARRQGGSLRSQVAAHVKTFMDSVNVDWTKKAISQAEALLRQVFRDANKAHSANVTVDLKIKPVKVPLSDVLHIEDVAAVRDRGDDFKRAAYFGTYHKSLFEVASFDAQSTEYQIAEVLESSGSVGWWQRLESKKIGNEAYIAVHGADDYYPDFVVYDKAADQYWIVEGKRSDQMQNEIVLAKADATLKTIGRRFECEEFAGQSWHYLLVDEKDVARSDNWDELKKREYRG